MSFENWILVSVLKLTQVGSTSDEAVAKDSRVPLDFTSRMLNQLGSEGSLSLESGIVTASVFERLNLAVRAASSGVDSETLSKHLNWQEFESLSAFALERNGYKVIKNLHFRGAGRRWEIDVVGFKKPLVLCIDCKHWGSSIGQSSIRRIVLEQSERTRAFCEALPIAKKQFECTCWEKAKFVPAVITLFPGNLKFLDDTPVVPVLQIQDFVHQLPAHVGSLKSFMKNFAHLT